MRKFSVEQLGNRELMAANVLAAFSPFGGFQGGVRVASGDVNGDGTPDVIVGAGVGGHVKIFDGSSGDSATADPILKFDPLLVDSAL